MDPLARRWIDTVILGSPVARALSASLVAAEPEAVTVRMPYDDRLTTTPETVHGGVISALVDIAGAAVSASGLHAEDGATGGVTSHLSVAFHAPAIASDLEAHATVVHRSRTATHSHVEVTDTQGRLVATGQVGSRIFY